MREEDDSLQIVLNGIGPGRDPNRTPPQRSIKDDKLAHGGMAASVVFRPTTGLSRDFVRSIAAVTQGIAARLAKNPNLTKVTIKSVDIMNIPLKYWLETHMGFTVVAAHTAGLETAYTLELQVPLEK